MSGVPETLLNLLCSQTSITFLVQLMHVVTYGSSPTISGYGLLEYYMTRLQLYHISVYIWVLHNQALTRKIITGISATFLVSYVTSFLRQYKELFNKRSSFQFSNIAWCLYTTFNPDGNLARTEVTFRHKT